MPKVDFQSLQNALSLRSCKIAYLGNSVTAQKNGYREHLHDLICKSTQQSHHAINAGIGGVGSLAAAFLLSDFVLRHKPDLCFIECSIADSDHATPRKLIQSSIDSILWQLSQANIPACMLYLYKDKQPKLYRQILREDYSPVVNYYKTSIIDIYPQIQEMVEKNQHQSSELLTDGIHTTELGAKLSAELILKGLLEINRHINLRPIKPWSSNSYLSPQILKVEEARIDIDGSIANGKFKLLIPYAEISQGSTLSITVEEGEIIGFLVIADDSSGVIDINSTSFNHKAQIHDEWCEKARIQVVILPIPIKPDETFSIKISKSNVASVGANLQVNSWPHLGMNLKIIGLLVNSTEALLKPKYLW